MRATIAKWGNSLAVRLPRSIAQDINLSPGSAVELRVEGGSVVMTPAAKKLTLAELLAGHVPEHRHDETDWGPPLGTEVW